MTKLQFRVLYRSFLLQIVDLELVPAHGDPSRLLIQIAALLAAASFMIAILILPPYAHATASQIASGAWGDQEFLISTTMAVVGLFTVLAWDSIFPNRRDSLVLGNLPIRPHTILCAKVAATGAGLGISLLAVNAATGLAYPFVIGGVRTFFAYWIVMAAAGLSIFCTLLAAQGMAALLLSYRRYLEVSNALQVAGFFSILGVYFLTPGPSELDLTSGAIPAPAWRLPSFWFLGLFQRLASSPQPFFQPLASRALWWLMISFSLAAVTFTLSYYRNMRRIVEEPDIVPAGRAHPAARWVSWIAGKRMPKALDCAVLLFLARTLARSRQHRNLLAAFGGLGLAISLTFAKGVLYGNSQAYALARHYGFQPPRWYEPNTPMMAAGFILLFLAIIGTRAVFALPATLKANWIFRVTAVHSPRAYFAAIRKSMFTLAAPVWIAAAVFYLSVWGGVEAFGHVAVLLAVGTVVVDLAFTGFCKMPFACAYAPGAGNLRVKLPVYGSAFLFAAGAGASIERTVFETAARTVVLGLLLLALAVHARRRWHAFAGGPFEQLQFEEGPTSELAPLDLKREVVDSRFHRYLDVIDAPPEPGFRQRAGALLFRTAIVTACFCAAGFVYEQVGQRRNPLPPRVGQSVDIGGRTLNYSCLGEGSPTVIFESGRGGPGKDWTPFQRQVAAYTRACWYDRAGYGWSDAAPFPHPASAIAEDLHRLLRKAGIAPSYVLVGFSFGGICVRVYADKYREEVAGMVLVDSTHFDEREPITPPGGGYLPYFPRLLPTLAKMLRPIGFLRMFMPRRDLTPFEPRTMAESFKELDYESSLQARAVRNLGDLPLIVLTAGRHRITPPDNVADARRQRFWEAHWIEAQEQLARLSTRGAQRVFPEASHNLARDRPWEVLDAIQEVVMQARAPIPRI
jgi:pimeloyl-ACP methyl ester carboxylesterase